VLLHNDHLQVELEPGAKIAPLVSILVREGAEVEEVRRGKRSLEDAFVTMMQEEEESWRYPCE